MAGPANYRAEVDGVVVALEDPGISETMRHIGLSFVAWVVAIVSPDPNPEAPNPPYRLVIRAADSGELLHDDGVVRGKEAVDAFEQAVTQLELVGAKDFLFKKKQGWRID